MSDDPITQFDFVGDERFRNSLTSDYREILRCVEALAWKAVHVLAGSVIEALLVDYLVTTDHQKRYPGQDPLKMDLAAVIEACKKEGVLSQRTAELSSVVRGYRNLIHPGRVIRFSEKINSQSGTIAKTLVDLIVDEITAARAAKYGFTAEQIANKIAKDSSAMSVLAHFLKETNDHERERLLTSVIPGRYFDLNEDFESDEREMLETCFRQTFHTLPDDRKSTVTRQFIKVLREEGGEKVLTYEAAFFRGGDLAYLTESEAELAKEHLLSRFAKEQTVKLMGAFEGIGPFLNKQQLANVTNSLMRAVAYGKTNNVKKKAGTTATSLFLEIPSDLEEVMQKRVDTWIEFLNQRGMGAEAALAAEIRASFETISF